MKSSPSSRQERIQQKVLEFILDAVTGKTSNVFPIYAQTDTDPDDKFWYKVYIFTPYGIWKSDTSGEIFERRDHAKYVIKSERLKPVTLQDLMHNWDTYHLWEERRPFSATLLQYWKEQQARLLLNTHVIHKERTMSVQLFLTEQGYAVQTECKTEEQFMHQFAKMLSEFYESDQYKGVDLATPLRHWMAHAVNICCAYRGYKTTNVETRLLYTAGKLPTTDNNPLHEIRDEETALLAMLAERTQDAVASTPQNGKSSTEA